jgi:predicted branched-subunit amino acid permease
MSAVTRAVFTAGLREGAPVGVTFLLAFLGVGAAFQVAGLGQAVAGLSTLFLMSGPAQVGMLDGLGAGRPLLAIVLAVCLLNGRYAVMSAVLAPYLRTIPLRRLLLPLCLLSTSTFAITQAGLRRRAVARAPLTFFQGVCLAAVPPAILGTVLGYHLAGLLPPALAGTVDMILPIYFATLLARDWPKPSPLLAALLGFVLMPVVERLLSGFGILVPGLIAGVVYAFLPEEEEK